MGSSASKAASKAATSTARKYPTRPAPPSAPTSTTRPSRSSPESNPHSVAAGPTVHPTPRATSARTDEVNLDAQDPTLYPNTGLQARLAQLGPVQPSATHSNSSTYHERHAPPSSSTSQANPPHLPTPSAAQQFQPSSSAPEQSIFPQQQQRPNPAISLLTARYRLVEEAEREFAGTGRKSAVEEGRRFLDVSVIRQVLVMREQGVGEGEIERRLGLGRGVVGVLGKRGVVGVGEV